MYIGTAVTRAQKIKHSFKVSSTQNWINHFKSLNSYSFVQILCYIMQCLRHCAGNDTNYTLNITSMPTMLVDHWRPLCSLKMFSLQFFQLLCQFSLQVSEVLNVDKNQSDILKWYFAQHNPTCYNYVLLALSSSTTWQCHAIFTKPAQRLKQCII